MRPERLYLLDIIEAAARLPETFRARHATVPWAKIVAFRNFVVHEYFGLDWAIVWQPATDSVPELRRQVTEIIALDPA